MTTDVEFRLSMDGSGVIRSASAAESALQKMKQNFGEVDDAANKTGETLERAGRKGSKATSGLGRNAAGAAVQFSQFTQQVAGGQNALLAFAQQSQDVGFLLGPRGALYASIASIAILVGVELVKAFKEAEKESVKLPDELNKRLEDIKKRLGEVGDSTRSAFLGVEFDKINQEYNKITEEIAKIEAAAKTNSDSFNGIGASAASAAGQINRLRKEQAELAQLLNQVGDLSVQGIATDDIAQGDGGEAERARSQARIDAITEAIGTERQLLQAHAEVRKAIERGVYTDQEAAAIEADIREQARLETRFDALVSNFEREREAILSNTELTEVQRQELIDQYNQLELEAQDNHNRTLEQQQQKHSDALVKIKEQEERAKLSIASQAFGGLSSLMNTESRKLFEIGKAAAISQAIIDTIAGANRALKDFPAPLSYAVAATTAAAGYANVRQISATQFGSASTGQSIQGGQVVNNVAQPQQPDRNITIATTGGGDQINVRQLGELLNELSGDGFNFTFAQG